MPSEAPPQEGGTLRRLAQRVLVLCSGTTLSHLLVLVFSPLLTRMYSPASFAVFGFHQATLAILALVLTCQFEGAIPIPKDDSRAAVLLRLALRVGFVGTLVSSILALVWYWLPLPHDWTMPLAVLLLVPICAYGEAVARCYRVDCVRQAQFSRMSVARFMQAIGTVASHLITGCLGWKMTGLPLGDGIGRWISAGYFYWLSQQAHGPRLHEPERPHVTWDEYRTVLREYIRFPMFVTPGVVIAALINVLPALVLPGLYGKEFAGQFALANRSILMPLMIISQAVTQVYVSDASHYLRNQDKAMRRLIWNTATQMGLLGLVLSGTAAVLGPLTFPTIFGAKWAVAGQIVPYLALSGCAQFIGGPVNQILVLLGKESRKLTLHIIGIVGVAAVLWGSHWYGLTAFQATAAYALTIVFIQGLYLWQSVAMVEEQVATWSEQERLAAA